jgi:group I intron endonuclease
MLIYKLTSPSGKVYIGQTSQQLNERLCKHVCASKSNRKTKMCSALRKYPLYLWTKEILFKTDDSNELNQKEIEYIQLFDSINNGYNITLGGDATNRGFKRSLETKERNRQANLGKKLSEATKRKMSISAKSTPKKHCEYCERMFDCGNYTKHHGIKCKVA